MAEVGLALAIIPLIISAADHYEDCIQPFKRYRNFTSEAIKYQMSFGTQKTIFRNESRLLLENIVDPAVAGAMLLDSNHPDWNSRLHEEQFLTLLGESHEAYVATISQITENLNHVKNENEKLEKTFRLANEPIVDDDRMVWTKSVRKKLKFCFSKSRHEAYLNKLKSLNDDYIKLSCQIRRLEGRRLDKKSKPSQILNYDVERFRTIQKAANYVYQALEAACTKHTEHETQLCLNAEQTISRETSSSEIRFKLAFIYPSFKDCYPPKDLDWFFIESIMKDVPHATRTQSATQAFSTIQTLKRNFDEPSTSSPPKKLQKRRMSQRTKHAKEDTSVAPVVSPSEPLLNLCVRGNFCDQLRIQMSRYSNAGSCLGRLNDTDSCQHLVYYSPRDPFQASPSNSERAVSLESLILKISSNDRYNHPTTNERNQYRRPTMYERVRLAKRLSIGLLQYYATPWMGESLRSNKIYFNVDDRTFPPREPVLSEPHLKVSMKASNTGSPSSSSPHLASNYLLFELGLLLIEIGYTATLWSLQTPQDLVPGGNPEGTEIMLSKRLGALIGREMGSAYGSVVRKCLQCDFAAGNDLSEPKLQAAFNQDVICELDELEKRLEKIYLDE